MSSKTTERLLVFMLFFLIVLGVFINYYRKYSIDNTSLPEKVEQDKKFQRWITNLKNKDLTMIDADQFELIEKNEIYNTKWLKVYSTDDEVKMQEFNSALAKYKDVKKIVFAPSNLIFIDYRNEQRDGYKPNEAHLYGVRDDKLLDARILDCSTRANCYFDRAYFLNNDLFVISEFSRNINKKDEVTPICPIDQECTYTIKIHVIDLINNSRLVYESKPFNIILSEVIPEL